MRHYKYEYIDSNNKRHTYTTYVSSWKKANENFERDNKDVKEVLRAR